MIVQAFHDVYSIVTLSSQEQNMRNAAVFVSLSKKHDYPEGVWPGRMVMHRKPSTSLLSATLHLDGL